MNRLEQMGVIPGILAPRSLIGDPACMQGEIAGDCLMGDLVLEDGVATRIEPPTTVCRGMVLPRLTEPHVHLDKCHTVDRIADVGGDLEAAILAQRCDKLRWTEADIRSRASRGLTELARAGCGAVRSHVDWGPAADGSIVPLAWGVLNELAQDFPDLTLQLAALTAIGQLSDPAFADATARRIARDRGVLGSFVLGQPEREAGVRSAFATAERHGLALDFHVDEGLDDQLDGVELIADVALEHRHQGPVLIGHACALMNLSTARLGRIADKLARAGISVASLPATNLYLQGRRDGTPERRGVVPVRELRAAGVNVVLGADNVRDTFCPIGRHDPRHTLAQAVLAAHLDPPLGDHLPMIATGARAAMGLDPVTIDGAAAADLLIFDAASTSELLTDVGAPRPLTESPRKEPA